MNSFDDKMNKFTKATMYSLNKDDPEELINFLKKEGEKSIFDLKIGEEQSTSKLNITNSNFSFAKCDNK
jgi:hypothetical protein